jgi:uncharacterized membrane protein
MNSDQLVAFTKLIKANHNRNYEWKVMFSIATGVNVQIIGLAKSAHVKSEAHPKRQLNKTSYQTL